MPVEAEHPGTCALCGEPIYEGDQIVNFEDEWCHAHCADEERDLQERYEQ